MSKKKSLGSSPIGYSTLGIDTFEFIPVIESASKIRKGHTDPQNGNSKPVHFKADSSDRPEDENTEKKIVSYYLEENLIERLKEVADEQKMYYSTLVGHAIFYWLENNGYE